MKDTKIQDAIQESTDEVVEDVFVAEDDDIVEILDADEYADDGIDAEIETGNDINGDVAAFWDIDDPVCDGTEDSNDALILE